MKVKIGLDRLRCFIVIGGFEVCQWSRDHPSVVSHLPPEARSESSELWLSQGTTDQHELTLGLRCQTDTLFYKHRPALDSDVALVATAYLPASMTLCLRARPLVQTDLIWMVVFSQIASSNNGIPGLQDYPISQASP